MNLDLPIEAEIEESEDGRVIHAVMGFEGLRVQTRVSRHLLKMEPEKAEWFLSRTAERLRQKLARKVRRELKYVWAPTPKRDPVRTARLREAQESQAAILFRRLAKMHGADPGSLKVVGAKPSECLRAIRKWIAAGKPEFGEVG